MARPTLDLRDRLTAEEGRWHMPGMQALLRLPLEQARRDRAAGLRVGTFVTGYPGSPMGGYDLLLQREAKLLDAHDVRHVPAGNEEQAATALMGTQMLDAYPHERYDGVVGFWYGKGPGIDRAGDALKHGNFAGTSRHGAVVLLSGEDHEAKSSTMPFQQEHAFMAAGIPVLYPGSVADMRRLGLHAVALSRWSGCWVALKLVSQLCDGGETVDLGAPVEIRLPALTLDGRPFAKRADFSFFPGKNVDHERHLYDERHAAVVAYARANGLDRVLARGPRDRLGIVTAGKSTADVHHALADLGLPLARLSEVGVRLLDVGLLYPLDAERVREFARGLERVIVVEEKRDVLETAVRAALQPLGEPIRVVGKRDDDGRPLFPVHGGFDADLVAERLAPLLDPLLPGLRDAPRVRELASVRAREHAAVGVRKPNFCSGCPHSRSTVLAEGQLAWGAPGCGCFNTVIEQPERHIDTMTQYGGEGLPWIGLAPYTERRHVVQHVGDGSLYHSSYLNIRFAVAAGAQMTFKVLFNGAVANTGAQQAVGGRGVAELVRGLCSEGVARVAIVTKEPARYARERFAANVSVRTADELVAVSRELEATAGVTVLLYDEACANERRRRQKRGLAPRPTSHLVINEAVCEGCGDCGAKSNCMSLQRVETELGTKTQIHGSSCNDDDACLAGECPSFVTVEVAEGSGRRRPVLPPVDAQALPAPARPPLDAPFHLLMPGVGGTGVITLNAVLAVAAQLDGIACVSYDQTGAAQKWGPVLSSLVLLPADAPAPSNKVGLARADLLLALDEVGAAAPANLDRCDPARTVAVLNGDLFPTGEMVRDVRHEPDRAALRAALERWTDAEALVEVPARTLAERCFGDYMLTNVVALGAAVQAGLVPISAAAIEQAIAVNGVGVEANLHALLIGRQWVADPAPLLALIAPAPRDAEAETAHRAAGMRRRARRAYAALTARCAELPEETRRLLAVRLAELIAYQSPRCAERYLDDVLRVAAAERALPAAEGQLAATVARGLFKLTAYKDEYEVARLLLDPAFAAQVAAEFEQPVRIAWNLHPPLLRRLGRERKLRLGPWFGVVLRVLRAGRRLRGTPLDPFGPLASRREERALIAWYRDALERALAALSQETLALAVELAALPDEIRGYERVKSRGAARARLRAEALLRRIERQGAPALPLSRH